MSVEDKLLELDPAFATVFQAVGKLDFSALQKNPYVALLGAILGQRIPYTKAREYRSILYKAYGNDFKYSDVTSDSGKWANVKRLLPADKVAIIDNVHRYLEKQSADYLTTTDQKQLRENVERMASIYGVGQWTIQNCLLVSGLDMDVFLPDDYFIKKRIQRMYNLSRTPSAKECTQYAEKWRPYRSTASWYLWRWF